jgi:hypothetical protein
MGENEYRNWQRQFESVFPPVITYDALVEALEKQKSARSDGKKGDDDQASAMYRSFDIKIDLKNKEDDDTYVCKVPVFESGTPLEWCLWREEVDALFEMMGVDEKSERRHNLYLSLLKGQGLERYKNAHADWVNKNKEREKAEKYNQGQLNRLIVNDVAKHIFVDWETAFRTHRDYVRRDLQPDFTSESPKTFIENLIRLNKFLKYFPVRDPLQSTNFVSEQELIETVARGVKYEWACTLLDQNKRYNDFQSLDEVRDVYFKLYQADQLRAQYAAVTDKNRETSGNGKNKRKNQNGENSEKSGKKSKAPCENCKKTGHKSDDCWTLEKNANKRPKNFRVKKKGNENQNLQKNS